MIGWRLPPAAQQLGGGYVAQVSIKYGWGTSPHLRPTC